MMSGSPNISLGLSTCPNDTFIFDALVNKRIDTEGLEFEIIMSDVEELNHLALNNKIDVTKVSFHAYMHICSRYLLMNSGSALGLNCGPLLISKRPYKLSEISDLRIAVPGNYTTALLLLRLAFSEVKNPVVMVFSDIEDAVLRGDADAGVIIHENRFTYESKGLIKLIDLGEFWESRTGLPIPLGGIVASRRLGLPMIQQIDRILNRSAMYAFINPKASYAFIRKHAQELSDEVIYQHIQTYVTSYTVDLGKVGRTAVLRLFREALTSGVINAIPDSLFIEQ